MNPVLVDCEAPFLPQEIITNILKRLPVKSLIRFQCVCKDWKNLFKSPSFIADHLYHSTRQNPSLLFQQVHIWDPLYLCLLSCNMQFHEVENSPLIDSLAGVQIIRSSNGLLCLNDYHGRTFLWNPAIREVRQLPITMDDFPEVCYLGFGYSPIINDYKIVKIYMADEICRVEVYSLNTGSWKNIEFENLEDDVVPLADAITFNGVMFWNGVKQVDEENNEDVINVIISFDIATEVIKVIALPDLFSHSRNITLYDNKLSIIDHKWTRNSQSSYIYLGVMEEGGVGLSGERWSPSKKYTFSHPFRLCPKTILNDQIVCIAHELPGLSNQIEREMEDDDQEKVGLYLFNVTNNECKKFAIPRHGYRVDVFNYVESLVSVGNFHFEKP